VIYTGTSSLVGTHTVFFQEYMTWTYSIDSSQISSTSTTSSSETLSTSSASTENTDDTATETSTTEEANSGGDSSDSSISIYIAGAIIGVLLVGGGLALYRQLSKKEEKHHRDIERLAY